MDAPTREDRVAGGLFGLLIGDALGVPYEFKSPSELPSPLVMSYQTPPGFPRTHAQTPPGTWSDDGAHALCLLASLLHCDALDLKDLGNRFLNWIEHGYMAVDDRVFDVGIQTQRALRSLSAGDPPISAGPCGERDNGNGSLMRSLPLSLWHRGTDEELARDACLQSRVTHGHVRSQVCCAIYVLWARRFLENAPNAWNAAVESARAIWPNDSAHRDELERVVLPALATAPNGTGYVLDTLNAAVALQRHEDFESVIRGAIALGGDTDTTACVAGGIAGLRFGLSGIPKPLRDELRGQTLVAPLLEQLLQRLRS